MRSARRASVPRPSRQTPGSDEDQSLAGARSTLLPLLHPWRAVHECRHTFASLLIAAGVDLKAISTYDDGSGFACHVLIDPREINRPGVEREGQWILNEDLLWHVGRCLHILGRHAAENCGAWGDALVEVRIVGKEMRLAYFHRMAPGTLAQEIDGTRPLDGAVSRHTVVVDAIATAGQGLTAATRLVATDLFHAFGSPEVRQIAADGTLRAAHLGGDGGLRAWAEAHGSPVTDDAVAGG